MRNFFLGLKWFFSPGAPGRGIDAGPVPVLATYGAVAARGFRRVKLGLWGEAATVFGEFSRKSRYLRVTVALAALASRTTR
jgi:hypothetical protein